MKIEEIQELWNQDSEINRHALDDESLKIPKLHSKYYSFYSKERLLKFKLEAEMKKLKLEKFEFYSQGPSEETKKKGWKYPAKGLILKTEIPMYIEADSDIINLTLKIALQNEKTEFLESCIKSLNNRGFNIKSAIDFIKWTAGN